MAGVLGQRFSGDARANSFQLLVAEERAEGF